MEKTVNLNGEDVILKSVAMTAIIYRSEFGEDIFKATAPFLEVSTKNGIDFSKIEQESAMRLFWAYAKTANRDFVPYREWVGGLEAFPLMDVMSELIDLVLVNLTSNMSQPKNAKAAGR